VPRSRRWTTDPVVQDTSNTTGRTRWEPTLAFPKNGPHRATIGDRLFAEVHIDVKMQQDRDTAREFDTTGARAPMPFIESVVYDYMGVDAAGTLILRETSRQGERIERSILHVRLKPNGPTKLRLPSGAVSIEIDDEQVAVITWLGT
jgi:hypothetical protein